MDDMPATVFAIFFGIVFAALIVGLLRAAFTRSSEVEVVIRFLMKR